MANDLRGDDVIDSRDVIERIAELEEEEETLESALEDAELALQEVQNEIDDAVDEDGEAPASLIKDLDEAQAKFEQAKFEMDTWNNSDEKSELEAMIDLQDDAGSSGEWKYGMQLIKDDHFPDYARQYAEEIGAISSSSDWPSSCIDWERAANELQMDYTSYSFNGDSYYGR